MLQLKQAYAAYPAGPVQHLRVADKTIIVYASADAVVLVDAHTLRLEHVLALSEAFPSISHESGHRASCIDVDSGMKYIFAASGFRIAVWALSELQNNTWRVHSTLLLPEHHVISTIDGQAGILAVGSSISLSVYTLVLENDLPTWSKKWSIREPSPSMIRFAPSLMYIAFLSKKQRVVTIYSTASGRETQKLAHPRPITNFVWRHSKASNRDDLLLYTVTEDSTLRIFLPVLDSPQHLQLHAALDLYSALPFTDRCEPLDRSTSAIFWLETDVVTNAITATLASNLSQEDIRIRRLKDIKDEGWDLFLRILRDGSVIVSAVANIDRRPPTLLRQFTLQHLPPNAMSRRPSFLDIMPSLEPDVITVISGLPLSSSSLSLLDFFDPKSTGLRLKARMLEKVETDDHRILKLIRTPEGHGLGVIRDRSSDIWKAVDHSQQLLRSQSRLSSEKVVVLQEGAVFAAYSESEKRLTLYADPPSSIELPDISLLFSMPSPDNEDYILAVTPDFSILHLHATYKPTPSVSLRSQYLFPETELSALRMIIPVDPMAWGTGRSWMQHDVLLSVSSNGELAFWVPEEDIQKGWRCTGRVNTGKTTIRKASCSSAKKTALIVANSQGDELTIWDSKESEFSTGLELSSMYSESIQDLDWTSTPDMQSILAVGFKSRVELVCQQRATYFDDIPGWATMAVVDISSMIPYQITDSIWLSSGSLVIGAGHQLLLYGSPAVEAGKEPPESLFEHVARFNGPLEDYHPQIILQCLIWGKVELVKDVIVRLAKAVVRDESDPATPFHWNPLPVERYLQRDQHIIGTSARRYDHLFGSDMKPLVEQHPSESVFSRTIATELISALETESLPHLTPNEQAHLLTLIQATIEIDEQRRALDANGLRYLISMRSFHILNRRALESTQPESKGSGAPQAHIDKRERIRYRDMIWAFHSESQDLLLEQSVMACRNRKMTWSDARALGIPVWLTSIDTLKMHLEVIARNEYMAGDDRDPTACSLYYFALGKHKLVHGLWRQAAWHKEQPLMLKFLSNDFSQERWRTAALKNAFALLSKQRFEYAAAFFLLGGSLKDAVNVCIRHLGDTQLAIAIARVVERSNEGPIFLDIIRTTVLPTAFKEGNRWLASWAFWSLKRRDLAVRVLLTPLQTIARLADVQVDYIGEPHYDDPGLALLFSQLRSKTLQAAKGTSEIPGSLEFNFVLQMARVFCRMGCHVLALDLVKSWSFERPPGVIQVRSGDNEEPPSPTSRRPFFNIANRRKSMVVDMQLPSLPTTRPTTPEGNARNTTTNTEAVRNDKASNKAPSALGTLMKTAKQDVQVPEFDINSFF